jgi:hypothetical protein
MAMNRLFRTSTLASRAEPGVDGMKPPFTEEHAGLTREPAFAGILS